MPDIIAFSGPKGSGKTTLADAFEVVAASNRINVERVSFAAPIKRMAEVLLQAAGMTEAEVFDLIAVNKEKRIEALGGVTCRRVCQTLGTEWGREVVAGDLWLRIAESRIASMPHIDVVIIDDARFINEYAFINKSGGVLVEVERAGVEYDTSPPSEQPTPVAAYDHKALNVGSPHVTAARLWDAIYGVT